MAEIIKFQKLEDLRFIQKQAVETIVEFCKLAFDYIKNGPNLEKYQKVASALSEPTPNPIQRSVEIIAQFLVDAVRTKAKEADFLSLKDLGFSQEHIDVLKQFVESKADNISKLLLGRQSSDLRYRDMDWRLEARVASRSLHSQAVPLITMKFHLDREATNEKRDVLNTTETQVVVQTDPNSLVHMIGQLEQALVEAKTHRTRNFVKAISK